MQMSAAATRQSFDFEVHHQVMQFLAIEAMLLDEGRFEEWFETLDEALVYEVPLRLAAERRVDELPADAYFLSDTKPMIRLRLDRLALDHAHVEAPPSRTVRSVASICLLPQSGEDVLHVSSVLTVYRHRGIDPDPDILHARRYDQLRRTEAGFRLLARKVVLAERILSTPNLAIFL